MKPSIAVRIALVAVLAVIGASVWLLTRRDPDSYNVKLAVLPHADAPAAAELLEQASAAAEQRLASIEIAADVWNDGTNVLIDLPADADVNAAATLLLVKGQRLEFIDPQGLFLERGTPVCTTAAPQPPAELEANCATTYTTVIDHTMFDPAQFALTKDSLGNPAVAFAILETHAPKLNDFSSQNIGQPMSIVLGNRVLLSPMLNGVMNNQGIITMGSAQSIAEQEAQAEAVLIALQASAQPFDFQLLETR